jgi:hypothetical protein
MHRLQRKPTAVGEAYGKPRKQNATADAPRPVANGLAATYTNELK